MENSKKVLVVGDDFRIPTAEETFMFHLRPATEIFREVLDIKDPLRGIDIDREYELIQQKKSSLPARIRRLVVQRKEADDGN